MKIYESLKDVLSPEQLDEFKAEVQGTIDESVSEKVLVEQNRLAEKAEQFVEMKLEEKTNELEEKAEAFCESQIDEAKAALVVEYDERMEEFESTVVESLDRFLDSEISENISEDLFESWGRQQALMPIVEGIQELFESKYVALDTEGESKLASMQDKCEELEEQLSESIAEKLELEELAEKAASELLVREKCEELTIAESAKVTAFFEGKSFDEIEEKIEGYIQIISEETSSASESASTLVESDDDCLDEKQPIVESHTQDRSLLAQASKYL
jgi:hypothetical protein